MQFVLSNDERRKDFSTQCFDQGCPATVEFPVAGNTAPDRPTFEPLPRGTSQMRSLNFTVSREPDYVFVVSVSNDEKGICRFLFLCQEKNLQNSISRPVS